MLSQQAGYADRLNRALGRPGTATVGGADVAATVTPGALGPDGVPGGEALPGAGAGDYVTIRYERYMKVISMLLIFYFYSIFFFSILANKFRNSDSYFHFCFDHNFDHSQDQVCCVFLGVFFHHLMLRICHK
jgi:hypothetical protein